MISTAPVCTPYRAMLTTGRHPQTTGHIINSIRTRYDEIGIGDAFSKQGYKTAWIGKWHLHTGAWPANDVPDWVPTGRSRLGFEHWKAYNQHMVYYDGFVNGDDWNTERWDGYETEALNQYAMKFIEDSGENPFACFISPQPPHWTGGKWAPDEYYERLPKEILTPANVPTECTDDFQKNIRNYLAMTLAIDAMVGELMDFLDRTGKAKNTLFIFTSDHGTQGGAHRLPFWEKRHPYRESVEVPFLIYQPGVFEGGKTNDTLTAPVDIYPTLCSLCGIHFPDTVEGIDLSKGWLGEPNAPKQEAVLTMNFSKEHDHFADGWEWRGVRTSRYNYAKWLNGKEILYDLISDPLEQDNLINAPAHKTLKTNLQQKLAELLKARNDALRPCEYYRSWVDEQRRVIRNAYGELPHPETLPDFSKLQRTTPPNHCEIP